MLIHLGQFARTKRLGIALCQALFILEPVRDLRRRPDVAFISDARWPVDRVPEGEGDWEVIPDLAIEVIGPSDRDREIQARLSDYFRYGVRQVWIVRPLDGSISIYESPRRVTILGPEDELDGGPILPGFRLPLSTLFPPPPTT